ncbi:hypothetical protein P2559Y_0027 [Croceibacter phage P2559Y]|uniref:Gp2.5-like ssDNA binding protein and ssDNA annealing protein n=1 Tax=Croceibacter phage P2559Y TaxID=1327037 RepID=UPI0003F4AAA9|nr:Gp2.5-like ssDNA binding protein and ssDNA annealing protein [Croceibacter phage P2559Y]AGM14090.1 hypothetical protein P2559Y_0027 [Croceibacter phage P2559Y]
MSSTKVITGKVRFSYAHVFEPNAIQEGQKEKYSVSILIPKTDKATIAKVEKAIEAAKQEGKGKWNGKIPAVLKLPLRDGDAERPDDEAYEGCMFLNANSVRKPAIVDADLEPIMDKDEFYSGCYGRAAINFYGYSASGNKGVAVGLNNLQKLEDGDRLSGGGSTAAEDFGSDDDLLG